MLFKAHRCRRPVEFYNVAAPFLRTLTGDENSHRSFGVKPGDKSIYDELHDEGTRFTVSGPATKAIKDIPQSLLYDEVDALEDEVLFPEEYLGEDNYIAVGESTNHLEHFEKFGQVHPMRFALDLGTDEELSDEDEDEDSIAAEPCVKVSSNNDGGRSHDIGTDSVHPAKNSSLAKNCEVFTNSEDESLELLKHPMVTFDDELRIPPNDEFWAAICRELATPDNKYTKTRTMAEKIAFKTIYAQYKTASSIGAGAFNARTSLEMKIQYERFKARESSKCKYYVSATALIVLNAKLCSLQGSLA